MVEFRTTLRTLPALLVAWAVLTASMLCAALLAGDMAVSFLRWWLA